MRINVAHLLRGALGERRSYSFSEITPDGLPVRGEVSLLRTNRSILVTGRVETILHLNCVRCLDEAEYPLMLDIEEEFFPTRDIQTGLPTLAEGSEGFVIGEDNVLDLTEALRQNIELNLPANPVCRADCAGLCQRCGRNLNFGRCFCTEESPDPRWSPLKEILSR